MTFALNTETMGNFRNHMPNMHLVGTQAQTPPNYTFGESGGKNTGS